MSEEQTQDATPSSPAAAKVEVVSEDESSPKPQETVTSSPSCIENENENEDSNNDNDKSSSDPTPIYSSPIKSDDSFASATDDHHLADLSKDQDQTNLVNRSQEDDGDDADKHTNDNTEQQPQQQEEEEEEEEEKTDKTPDTSTQQPTIIIPKPKPTIQTNAPPTSLPLTPISPIDRSSNLTTLRSYESKRRNIYLTKYNSSSLYWRSFRELIICSLEETQQAEIMIRGNILANEAYANFCTAASQNRLDLKGNIVDEKKSVKIHEERMKRYNSIGTYGNGVGTTLNIMPAVPSNLFPNLTSKGHHHSAATASNSGSGSTTSPSAKKTGKLEKAPHYESAIHNFPGNATVLSSLIESQSFIADRFTENVVFTKENTLKNIMGLRQELEDEARVMQRLGDSLLSELKAAEDDVQETWDAYYTVAQKALSSSRPKNILSNTSAISNSTKDEELKFTENCTDVWLMEMHYRMSVAYLTTIWDKSSKELAKLFSNMKEMESNRRSRLREIMVQYMQRQERLFLSIPSQITPVMQSLLGYSVDKVKIDTEVQTQIRNRALTLQREEENSKKASAEKKPGRGLTNVPDIPKSYELQSPLMSELMIKADVVEKKTDRLGSIFKPTLAIATADAFLHLFELPPTAKLELGSAAEVAFHWLVPPVEITTEAMAKAGRKAKNKAWFQFLTPAESICLTNSAISFSEREGNSTFEITEVVENTNSATKMFMKSQGLKRKFTIRLYSGHEMVNWLLALRGQE